MREVVRSDGKLSLVSLFAFILLFISSYADSKESFVKHGSKPFKIVTFDDKTDLNIVIDDNDALQTNEIIKDSEKVVETAKELLKKPTMADSWPVVINTWAFTEATRSAWTHLVTGGSALDAVEIGCTKCEELQCDTTVGFGGSPDENGETTLDAMIMDGETHAVGAVGCLRKIKNAIGVARKVLEHTGHTLLVGELATDFAVKMGFPLENLTTEVSEKMHTTWKESNCQPNFWRNVNPDPEQSCGPYSPRNDSGLAGHSESRPRPPIDQFNHDTISMIAIDSDGRIASGTSSNGARHKIPGRVGDAPITGAGSYVDKEVGGAGATGDGDIMARFLPSLVAVEEMRRGRSPEAAARYAMSRIIKYYPNFSGGLVTVNLSGEIGAACHGLPNGFPFSYVTPSSSGPDVKVDVVQCI